MCNAFVDDFMRNGYNGSIQIFIRRCSFLKQIAFMEKNVAALRDVPDKVIEPGKVLVKMHYTAVSAGTERANLIGDPSVSGARTPVPPTFPRVIGYSGTGYVEQVGEGVTSLKPGDAVMTYWGQHQQYNLLPEKQVIKLPDGISMEDATFVFISTFGLAAVRKVKIELGESAMVVGLGLLGLFSVQYAHLAGAVPVIAVDMNPERRALALKLGADIALDPTEEGYVEHVKSLTNGGKGVNAIVEVTGRGDALNTALLCAAPFARVALLGCTRQPTTVDFYHDVHFPGITLIGAHTHARPEEESYPGYWTHNDDCRTALKYLSLGRLNIHDMIHEIHSPAEAPEVFNVLAFEPQKFPIGVLFDWWRL